MDEQKKYEAIKTLADTGGNKNRAAMTLNISRRQVDRLVNAYRKRVGGVVDGAEKLFEKA